MNASEFRLNMTKFKWIFSTCTPIDTGNLRYNAVRMRYLGPKECRIYVDTNIAPYMVYTNEPWIADRWKGAKNPNEGWFKKAVETAISSVFGGAQILKDGKPAQLQIFTSATRYKPKRNIVKLKTFNRKGKKK